MGLVGLAGRLDLYSEDGLVVVLFQVVRPSLVVVHGSQGGLVEVHDSLDGLEVVPNAYQFFLGLVHLGSFSAIHRNSMAILLC